MARLPRLSLATYPHLVTQRGNNGQAIASSTADYQMLLALLDENARKFGVAIHAYVLMGNHFQLLATPSSVDGLPQMMQALGRRYVRYFNDRHDRSGTLWEGRYRCSVIQPERHLLDAMAYLDLNPVRAGLAQDAAGWPWSSHAHYVGATVDRLVTPHPLYWQIGNTPFERERAWGERVRTGIAQVRRDALTESLLGGWALGDAAFVADLEKRAGRRAIKGKAGRPRLQKPAESGK